MSTANAAVRIPEEETTTLRQIFANNLSRLLHERRMTGKELAKSIGITGSAVTSWINGRTSPELSRMEAIASKLRVEPIDLFLTPAQSKRVRDDGTGIDQLLLELAAVRGKRLVERTS